MTDPTLLVLSSLAEGDKHGYAMMQDIEGFSGVRLGPGTLLWRDYTAGGTGLDSAGCDEGPAPALFDHARGAEPFAGVAGGIEVGSEDRAGEAERGMRAGLLRLYPGEWRQRYGDEFEALLEDVPAGWPAYFDLLRGAMRMRFSGYGFSRLAAMLSIAGVLAGLGASYMVRPVWESTATLRLAAATGAEARDRVMRLQNDVLSRSLLAGLIQNPGLNLYEEDRAHKPLEDIVETMRRDIHLILSSGEHSVFLVSFDYYDRLKAKGPFNLWSPRLLTTT